MVSSQKEYEARCQAAYNLHYGPERLDQTEIGKRLGISQQLVSKSIKKWKRILEDQKKPSIPVGIKGPIQSLTPSTIAELTFTLGYTNKPFHEEWYDYANVQRRFLLLAPRRHAKSTCLSINYVLWRIVKNPNIRILLVSNTDLQARAFVRVVKQLIEQYYPLLIPSGREKWAETAIVVKRDEILKEPTLSAVGVNGPIISRRQDLIIGDDLIDSENA